MVELEPNIDAYGTRARVSAIADFVELLALGGSRPRRSSLADYIDDVSWGSRVREAYVSARDVEDSPEDMGEGLGTDSEAASFRVFRLLGRRADVLGQMYPFRIGPEHEYVQATDASPNPYLALLGITIAHAFTVRTELDPRLVFEDTVSQALADIGLKAVNFASFRRKHPSFEDALTAAGPAIELRPTPLASPVRRAAQDAGADVLGHLVAGYAVQHAVGAWTFVGQATCGRSDTWENKLGDVKSPGWRMRLNSIVEPQAFLAVPHHAEPDHLEDLVINGGKIVLDRIRLTKMGKSVSQDERVILEAVKETPLARGSIEW